MNKGGRKYSALLISGFLFLVTLASVIFLSILGKQIPSSLGIALVTFASAYPGYLGVNAWQKKVQSGEGA